MDDFKDFFKDLRDRVSNPFVVSFIISWLFANWPITVALIFYDDAEVKSDGFRSLYHLIAYYATFMSIVIEPVLSAIIFTFCFPYIKSWIKLHNAKLKAKNESSILKATSENSVSLKRYIEMLDETKNIQKKLEEVIESQSKYQEENILLVSKLNDKDIEISRLKDSLANLQLKIGELTKTKESLELAIRESKVKLEDSQQFAKQLSEAISALNDENKRLKSNQMGMALGPK